jgi:hypothetical protein
MRGKDVSATSSIAVEAERIQVIELFSDHAHQFLVNSRRLLSQIRRFFRTIANSYAAAVEYEALSKLSNAELRHRGITRSDLHSHVFN